MKYFLMGAVGSAFLLMGMAFLYGASGTTDLGVMARTLATGEFGWVNSVEGDAPQHLAGWTMTVVGIGLLLVGLGFKVGMAPFHLMFSQHPA